MLSEGTGAKGLNRMRNIYNEGNLRSIFLVALMSAEGVVTALSTGRNASWNWSAVMVKLQKRRGGWSQCQAVGWSQQRSKSSILCFSRAGFCLTFRKKVWYLLVRKETMTILSCLGICFSCFSGVYLAKEGGGVCSASLGGLEFYFYFTGTISPAALASQCH